MTILNYKLPRQAFLSKLKPLPLLLLPKEDLSFQNYRDESNSVNSFSASRIIGVCFGMGGQISTPFSVSMLIIFRSD